MSAVACACSTETEFTSPGDKRSLKTRSESEAKKLFNKYRRDWLQGILLSLEAQCSIILGEFKTKYLAARGGMSFSRFCSP